MLFASASSGVGNKSFWINLYLPISVQIILEVNVKYHNYSQDIKHDPEFRNKLERTPMILHYINALKTICHPNSNCELNYSNDKETSTLRLSMQFKVFELRQSFKKGRGTNLEVTLEMMDSKEDSQIK